MPLFPVKPTHRRIPSAPHRVLSALALYASLAVGALPLTACTRTATATDAAAPGPGRGGGRGGASAIPVATTHVLDKTLPVMTQTVGNVEAFSTVEIHALVAGQLMSVNFAEGDDVKQGQLLFTIDRRPFEVALRQAQATLAKDQAQADNAKGQLKRDDDLLKRGLMTQADYDTQVASTRTLEETLKADQAQIDSAKLNLDYTQVTAPIGGRTGALLVHQGSLIRTTDTSPLVVINQITPIRVTFNVPANLLPQIQEEQSHTPLSADVRPSGQQTTVSNGTVTFIDNTVDATTATIRLKATFPNTDRRLWPGEFVEVRLRLSIDQHAIVVPASAVQNSQTGQYVYVVAADRTVSLRVVTVARSDGGDSVIASGLQVGEEVVTDGQLRLMPGVKVVVKPPVGDKVPS
jgi:multidrug efflux system membrane fusion protein